MTASPSLTSALLQTVEKHAGVFMLPSLQTCACLWAVADADDLGLQAAYQQMTAFQRNFWRRKARHMQMVFFMRVGAFYDELYDVRSSRCLDRPKSLLLYRTRCARRLGCFCRHLSSPMLPSRSYLGSLALLAAPTAPPCRHEKGWGKTREPCQQH